MAGTPPPDTRAELDEGIRKIASLASELYCLLEEGCTKAQFIKTLCNGDKLLKQLKGVVVRHSRSRGDGIRFDGKPDKRHRKWKKGIQ